jgi:peroxiredoxin
MPGDSKDQSDPLSIVCGHFHLTEFNMKNLKTFSSLMIVFTLVVSACGSKMDNSSEMTADIATKASTTDTMKAPDFEVTTIDGNTISLRESLEMNKPVVVYFTASWCPTCAKNWPALSEVYPEFKDRLTLVAISIDPTDTKEVMTALAQEKGFTFPSTAGNPQIMLDFGVKNQATTVGVDRDGNIAFTRAYQAVSADDYRMLFNELVN